MYVKLRSIKEDFLSCSQKAFLIKIYFLNIVGVCPKHFISTGKKHFY